MHAMISRTTTEMGHLPKLLHDESRHTKDLVQGNSLCCRTTVAGTSLLKSVRSYTLTTYGRTVYCIPHGNFVDPSTECRRHYDGTRVPCVKLQSSAVHASRNPD